MILFAALLAYGAWWTWREQEYFPCLLLVILTLGCIGSLIPTT